MNVLNFAVCERGDTEREREREREKERREGINTHGRKDYKLTAILDRGRCILDTQLKLFDTREERAREKEREGYKIDCNT